MEGEDGPKMAPGCGPAWTAGSFTGWRTLDDGQEGCKRGHLEFCPGRMNSQMPFRPLMEISNRRWE